MRRACVWAMAFCLTIGAVAQQASTAGTPSVTPDQVVRHYDSKLSLTDSQKAQLRPIIVDRQQRMLTIKNDTSSLPRMKAGKMKAVIEDEDKKIKGVLTGDQWTKYQAMEKEAREQAKEKRTGG